MSKELQMRAAINQKLIEMGERERLKELLRAKLIECGWRDQLKAHCKEVIKEKGIENVTVEDLVAGVTPKGRDDTGCPSSQCPSPAKVRSSSDNSSLGSPIQVKSKAKVKRVRVNVVAECNGIKQKHNTEQHQTSILHKGSEADFSSASSTGSFKSRGTIGNSSTGKKSCLSHSRVPHIRSQPVFKPPGSPTASRDAELYVPYTTPPKKTFSSYIGKKSSPSARRATTGSYHSCGDNHGIRAPNPEQYLTPLQQKEVTIRHLRTKLGDAEQTISDRESEVQELKSQLDRMREDWIEEECHRVEAQLSLKEARKEIKQLRQVVETMKNSLMEKDKGIQKYFIDINIQNRKLETLLHSMELAQSGANLHDEPTLDFICDSPEKPLEGKEQVKDQEDEEITDSGLIVSNGMSNQTNRLEQVLMSTALDYSQDCSAKLMSQPGLSTLLQNADDSVRSSKDQIHIHTTTNEQHASSEKAIQTDESLFNPNLQTLLLHLLNLQNTGISSHVLQKLPKAQESSLPPARELIKNQKIFEAQKPNLIPCIPAYSTMIISQDPGGLTQSLESDVAPGLMEELDFGKTDTCSSAKTAVVAKSHSGNNFLVDLVAAAAPLLPTVSCLYSQHSTDDRAPGYNMAALIRGCCIMGLHSLRLVTYGPHM
ncbi:Syntabulin [Bagarius yarrelli]|uniref:Transcription and mRNA export factor ENY2 n=2 Tax=Siluroidei TaxID=1489793 RepID=A0A556V071_BAGYA|nr:Syntabulin [Bagarius yarrelli]